MSTAPASRPAFMGDADYHSAQRFLHLGEWTRAQVLLEILDRRYPEVGVISQALVLTQLKAELDVRPPVPAKRWIIPWRLWLRRGLVLLVPLILLGLAVPVTTPTLAPRLAELIRPGDPLDAAIAEGNALATAGRYDEADTFFNALLTEHPDDAAVLAALAAVSTLREVHARYQQAVAAEEQGDLATAVTLLRELVATHPDYADAGRRLARLERHQRIDALIAEVDDLRSLGLNQLVVERMEHARSLEPAYRHQDVTSRLQAAYLDLAQAILTATPPQPDQLPLALGYLDKVLDLAPSDQVASDERRWIDLYLEGATFAAADELDLAVTRWQTLYDERPDYLGGTLAEELYRMRLTIGSRLRDAGECAAALEQYNLALTLNVADGSAALARVVETQSCLPPTPALLPTATPAP